MRASEPGSSATGVAVRASAAATPDARPMNDQLADDEPPERAGRARRPRWSSSLRSGVSRPPPRWSARLHDARLARRCPGHPPDQEPALHRAEAAQRDERSDLDEHEDAVRRGEFIEIADAQRRARIARQRHDDEADERDRRVAREHDRQPVGAERRCSSTIVSSPPSQTAANTRCRPSARDRRVVARGARRVALLRHGHEGGDGEHRHEHERGVVAHREAQHGDGGGR